MSYLGGVQAIKRKLASFAHIEAAAVAEQVEARIKAGRNIFGGSRDQFAVPLTDDFPPWLVKNKERFAHLILPCDKAYCRRVRWWRLCAQMRGVFRKMLIALVPRSLMDFVVRIWQQIHYR